MTPSDILLFVLACLALSACFGNVTMRASCSTGDEAGLVTLLFLVEPSGKLLAFSLVQVAVNKPVALLRLFPGAVRQQGLLCAVAETRQPLPCRSSWCRGDESSAVLPVQAC